MFACISYFSFRSMLVSCIIRIFHVIYFFFPVSTISTFQIKIGMHFLIFFWRSFKDNIYIVISFHSLRRIYFVWANRDLPLRYNREEHCPTVIKAVFSAAVPFGKGFWKFDLYLPLKLQLPPPPPPNAWVVFEIREKQNKTMFSGRLIILISFFLFLRCSWCWMRVLWSRWMFMRKHWLMKPSNVPNRCHRERTSTMGSAPLVSHQLIDMAGGTLSFPIAHCRRAVLLFKLTPVRELQSFCALHLPSIGDGSPRGTRPPFRNPSEAGSALQLSIWTLLNPRLVLELSGFPGSLPGRVSCRQRDRGACKPWTPSEWVSCFGECALSSVCALLIYVTKHLNYT